jgi:hypothetical protein
MTPTWDLRGGDEDGGGTEARPADDAALRPTAPEPVEDTGMALFPIGAAEPAALDGSEEPGGFGFGIGLVPDPRD